jgi:hypothetical protein
VSAIEPGNRLGGYLDFLFLAKCEYEERHESTEGSERPSTRCARSKAKPVTGKEGVDRSRSGCFRHFDRLILAPWRRLTLVARASVLLDPVGVSAGDTGAGKPKFKRVVVRR